jgi:hypothetical protein
MSQVRHRCQVCRHDDRWRIELLRAGGASLDSLATKFNVDRDAIWRHWSKHVSPEMKATYLAGPVQLQELAEKAAAEGGSIIDHLHAVRVILMGNIASMNEAGDGRGVAYLSGRLTHVLETIAKVTGELGTMAQNINISTTNVAILAEHPAFVRMQATMLRALAAYPDARASVVAALRALDGETAEQSSQSMKVIEHAA